MTEDKKYGVTNYDRPSWDDYFVAVSAAIGKRSTCDRARAGGGGCVIAKDNQIVSTGYAGSPPGIEHCDDVGHEIKETIHQDGSVSKHCVRTTHSEINAIGQAAKNRASTKDATLYCFMTPCYNCAKAIMAAGIIRVVAINDYHSADDTKRIFTQAGIALDILGKAPEY